MAADAKFGESAIVMQRQLRPEEWRERIAAWHKACEPFVKQKVRLYGFVLPTYTVSKGGIVAIDYQFDAHIQAMLDQCDEQIDYLRAAYGLPPPEPKK